MRLLVYNIAYGTGAPNGLCDRLLTFHRYLRTPRGHLDRIIDYLDSSGADILGLVEVDTGSYRTCRLNQVETVANHLSHYHHCGNKYGEKSFGRSMPFLRDQANAILARDGIAKAEFHYFPIGFKRLILEAVVGGVRIFLVHLALKAEIRGRQLAHLAKLAVGGQPTIIAGDFNTFGGESELAELRYRLDLINPNAGAAPTYPSWYPRRQLDFILCSRHIAVDNFIVEGVRFSDHLPLVMDFHVV